MKEEFEIPGKEEGVMNPSCDVEFFEQTQDMINELIEFMSSKMMVNPNAPYISPVRAHMETVYDKLKIIRDEMKMRDEYADLKTARRMIYNNYSDFRMQQFRSALEFNKRYIEELEKLNSDKLKEIFGKDLE